MENRANERFCTSCGTSLAAALMQSNISCSYCNTKNKPGDSQCWKCGNALAPPFTPAPQPAYAPPPAPVQPTSPPQQTGQPQFENQPPPMQISIQVPETKKPGAVSISGLVGAFITIVLIIFAFFFGIYLYDEYRKTKPGFHIDESGIRFNLPK